MPINFTAVNGFGGAQAGGGGGVDANGDIGGGFGIDPNVTGSFAGLVSNTFQITGDVTDICLTASFTVNAGSFPFVLELRIEDTTNGSNLSFNQTVNAPGTCTIGGDLADGVNNGGFAFSATGVYQVVTAVAPADSGPDGFGIDIAGLSLDVCLDDATVEECTNEAGECNICEGTETAIVFDPGAIFGFGTDGIAGGGAGPADATNTVLNGGFGIGPNATNALSLIHI